LSPPSGWLGVGAGPEAFELAGYQVLGCAPTGIAAVGLADEGFADARTLDRLLLNHADRAGAKVVLVGDDRQFASIAAGGGFRALRHRLGASELTVNRRQVEAWERQAIDDVRAGNLEQAIAAYAEHDRIRAFEARDDRDRALVNDWWQAQQAGQQPVIYAHRRAQVDQLNTVCQRLRAEAGQLGAERLVVGDRSFAVGDVVVLGANARDLLGVVNGTTATVTELDPRGRAMTVRTLGEEPPKRVRLPGWYLDGQVHPGQSRRVDLAYARTDMRSQGRTERRRVWRVAAAELDDYRRAYGLDHAGPAKHRWGRMARDGRPGTPATSPIAAQADATRGQPGRRSRASGPDRRGDPGRPVVVGDQRQRVDSKRLLGVQPRRPASGRRRDWQTAQVALERLAAWDRHRGHRDHGIRIATGPAGLTTASPARSATAASRLKGAADVPAPRAQRPSRRGRGGRRGAGHAHLWGQRPVGSRPHRRGAPALHGRLPRPACPGPRQRLECPAPTRAPPPGSPDPSRGWV
jgi:AAA domain